MSGKYEWRMVRILGSGPKLPVRLVAHAEGYAMVRRKGAMPFVVSWSHWCAASITTPNESTPK